MQAVQKGKGIGDWGGAGNGVALKLGMMKF